MDFMPLTARLDDPADRRLRERQTEPLEGDERRARGDDRLEPADRLEHVGEAVADTLERGLRNVERRRRERQAVDRATAIRIPPERPLAPEKGQERQSVRRGRPVGKVR